MSLLLVTASRTSVVAADEHAAAAAISESCAERAWTSQCPARSSRPASEPRRMRRARISSARSLTAMAASTCWRIQLVTVSVASALTRSASVSAALAARSTGVVVKKSCRRLHNPSFRRRSLSRSTARRVARVAPSLASMRLAKSARSSASCLDVLSIRFITQIIGWWRALRWQ